ncbi:DUF4277 domain-containing protein [Planktothrix agardhii 1803]|nr:DUF4277 domain-containing protein [Planktothrix agardhii]MCF3585690.1 DUF4277 domain-containing protein [Planktothrix agardhii 1803]
MKNPLEAIEIVNLDHLGIVAGVIDEMELVSVLGCFNSECYF